MKLSPAQRAALQLIDAEGMKAIAKVHRRTLVALWSNGLIEDGPVRIVRGEPRTTLRLSKLGRVSLKAGRVMLSRRRP